MKHEIDLTKYNVRTDLAIDNLIVDKNNEIKSNTKVVKDVSITSIKLNSKEAKLIGKKPGSYITIEFKDITDYANNKKVTDIFSNTLKDLLKKLKINKKKKGLIIGLGNNASTPDCLGPLSVDKIVVTRHLYKIVDVDKNFSNIAVIKPGVMGETGLETATIINGIVAKNKIDYIIVIDALKSNSISRLNKTIQITDTGIHPGSGVGNKRKEISKDTLGIPVIAIGVPTVVDVVTVVSDTVEFMNNHFLNITKDDNNLLGLIGDLSGTEKKQLFFEVLTPLGYNLIVTPKEIDFIIEKLSQIIGEGLNNVLHE